MLISNLMFINLIHTCLHKDKYVNFGIIIIIIIIIIIMHFYYLLIFKNSVLPHALSFTFVIDEAVVNNHGLIQNCIREEEHFFS